MSRKGEHTMDSSLCYEEFIKKIITLVWIEEFIYEYPLLFRVIIEESIKAMNYFQEVDVNLKMTIWGR